MESDGERESVRNTTQGENGMIAEIFVFVFAGLIALLCYLTGGD